LPASAPSYDVDFYADEFILDPYPHYTAMRKLGPVVYLPQLDNFALTQHAAVQNALRDHTRFISSNGVAGDKFGCEFLQGNTVASDPPKHSKLRRAMATPLLPGALKSIQSSVEEAADVLVDGLIRQEQFDAIEDFARYLPLKIVTDMVGLPDFGRDNMLKWAAAAFDMLGVQNERGTKALEAISEMRAFIAGQVTRDTLKPGSWTYRVLELVDQGSLDAELAAFAIRDYINPSLDTTISATGQLIWQLAQNPDQWQILRDHPELCDNAVNEAVRLGTPIRSFSRHASTDVDIEGVIIPKGARVMMLFASANRDEAKFENPDQFDVTRNAQDHLGFGSGIHMCVGMHLARLEMVSLLKAMIYRVERIEIGKPTIVLNNTIAAFATLPTTFHPDIRDAPAIEIDLPMQDWLDAEVLSRDIVAKAVVCLALRSSTAKPFPVSKAGAHIDLYIADGLVRQYSLTGRMSETYTIAIQNEPQSRGGSKAVHEQFEAGSSIRIGRPRNSFPLSEHSQHSILFSGGIGLTPILAMSWELYTAQRTFEWHLSARSMNRIAFGASLQELPFADCIFFYLDDDPNRALDVASVVYSAPAVSELYVCGPTGYMNYIESTAIAAGTPRTHIHKEHFGAEINIEGESFEVFAQNSNITVEVGANESILTALNRAGISVPTSCQNGVCGSCLTDVLEGRPEHRDLVLTDSEKASNNRIAVCCSRSNSKRLVLAV